MKTFHVGSLPFLSVEQALDFTFKFDIPTLFTLPKLDNGQLIGSDMIHLLDLGSVNGYENIKVNDPTLAVTKKLTPYYAEEFFKRFEKTENETFKYQGIGPISFYSILKRSNNVAFKDVYRFLLNVYTDLFASLANHGKVILVLDEPMLGSDFLSTHQALNNFVEDLEKTYPEVLVHCCAKLSMQEISQMNMGMNLDLNLYSDDELRSLNIAAPGLSNQRDKNYNILAIKNLLKEAKYFTPSCGLAYKTLGEVDEIFDFMQKISN